MGRSRLLLPSTALIVALAAAFPAATSGAGPGNGHGNGNGNGNGGKATTTTTVPGPTTTTAAPTTTTTAPAPTTTTTAPAPTTTTAAPTTTTTAPAPTTTTTAAPPALKAQASGVCDRQRAASPAYRAVVNCSVVNVSWADLQPVEGGPIVDGNLIDQAVAAARQHNAEAPGLGAHLKLRVFAGSRAPEWAKRLDGEPVSLSDPQTGGPVGTVPRFWAPRFGSAYDDLMAKLAARYDSAPEVREVVVSRCTTQFAEPFLRQAGLKANRDAYFAAGYTTDADRQCLAEQLTTHDRWWRQTRSSVAFNPFQVMTTTGTATDEALTEEMMDRCRALLAGRCVLGNNSISSPLKGGAYESLYAHVRALGGPVYFQTETSAKIGDWRATLDWAVAQGARMVEVNVDYDPHYPVTELAGYDERLEANAG